MATRALPPQSFPMTQSLSASTSSSLTFSRLCPGASPCLRLRLVPSKHSTVTRRMELAFPGIKATNSERTSLVSKHSIGYIYALMMDNVTNFTTEHPRARALRNENMVIKELKLNKDVFRSELRDCLVDYAESPGHLRLSSSSRASPHTPPPTVKVTPAAVEVTPAAMEVTPTPTPAPTSSAAVKEVATPSYQRWWSRQRRSRRRRLADAAPRRARGHTRGSR
jgi:hypothetical protein